MSLTLKKWRQAKGWSQNHLAGVLSKRTGQVISQQNIYCWENGVVPDAVIGEAIRKLTGGKVTGDSFARHADRG